MSDPIHTGISVGERTDFKPGDTITLANTYMPTNKGAGKPMSKTATGTAERIRVKDATREGTPHLSGTIRTYNPLTGDFTAHLDIQDVGEDAVHFTYIVCDNCYATGNAFQGMWEIVQ